MSNSRGFTLLEITIVLIIVALLISGLLGPMATRMEARDRAETLDSLEEIKEALYGYALATGALPCPDTDTPPDGEMNASCDTSGSVEVVEGILPWVDLGVPQADAWGNLFLYSVTDDFTVALPSGNTTCVDNSTVDDDFDLCTVGDIDVETRDSSKSKVDLAEELPALVLSYGKNGLGATRIDGTAFAGGTLPNSSTAEDEDENVNDNDDKEFMSRIYSGDNSGCDDGTTGVPYCAFDDLVIWLSPYILKNRMVMAGKL